MDIFGKLFGSDKVVDGVIKGADAVFFTPEEKAEHWLKVMKAYEPFKLAQRLLAFMIIGVYLAVWVVTALMFIGAVFADTYLANQLLLASERLGEMNNETLGMPAALIVGFYFAGGTLEGAIGKWKGKK